jgi:hypothetical protein
MFRNVWKNGVVAVETDGLLHAMDFRDFHEDIFAGIQYVNRMVWK